MTRSFWLSSRDRHPNRGFTYGLLLAFVFGSFCFLPFAALFNWQLGFAHENFYGLELARQAGQVTETMQLVSAQIVLLTSVLALVLGPLGLWMVRKSGV